MKRRSRAGGEPAKPRRQKTVKPKRRNAPNTVGRRGSSAPRKEAEVARLTRELKESLAQQTATAEILGATLGRMMQ